MSRQYVKSALCWFVFIFVFYTAGYGFLRWRKILVRYEYYQNEKAGPLVSQIDAGRDLCTSGIAAFKNQIAPSAATLYAPLRCLESAWRNSR